MEQVNQRSQNIRKLIRVTILQQTKEGTMPHVDRQAPLAWEIEQQKTRSS